MASYSPIKSAPPIVAKVRHALNEFARFEDVVDRSLAALATYTTEMNAGRVSTETHFLRRRIEAERERFTVSLNDIMSQAKMDNAEVS